MGRFLAALICLIVIGLVASLAWPEASYEPFEPDKAYAAQAARYTVPPMPEDWTQHLWEAPDGTLLRWGETGNRHSAKATLVWVPGYTATIDMYGEHFDRLARRGYHVMAVDLRGQGMSARHRPDQPEKLHVASFGTYSDDLAGFLRDHAPDDRPVVPFAMSFGGHVALRMALEHGTPIDGLFLVAPAVAPNMGENGETTRRVANFMRALGNGQRYLPGQSNWRPVNMDLTVAGPDICASDPKRAHLKDVIYLRQPQQRVGGVTAAWGLAFMESAGWLAAPGRMSNLLIPVHMLKAETEVFVDNAAVDKACTSLPRCESVLVPGTAHCMNQEPDTVLERMWSELDAFVASLPAERTG